MMKMLSQPNSSASLPQSVEQLVSGAIEIGDIYSAAAVYGIANQKQAKQLEHILTAKRRNVLALGAWEHTPSSVLQLFSKQEDKVVRIRLDKNPSTQTLTLNGLFSGERSRSLIALIAKHRNSSRDVLFRIAELEADIEIIRSVCLNSNSDSAVLSLVNQRFPGKFESELASHPETSVDLLNVLFNSKAPYVRAAVAKHERCPGDILYKASLDTNPIIRRHLASNKNLPIDYMSHLINDAEVSVRRAAVANMKVPEDLAKILIHDEALLVRRALAGREDLCSDVLLALTEDKDHWVKQLIARNPNMPREQLANLALDENFEIRRSVARNLNSPHQLLAKLAEDPHHWVRAAVSYNPKTRTDLLQKLAQDDDVDVLSGVASNQNTRQDTLKVLSKSKNDDIRRGVILNSASSKEILKTLLEDSYYLHRLLLTRNKTLSNEDKWPLHCDPDPFVRFAVFSWFTEKMTVETVALNAEKQQFRRIK